MPVKTVSEFIEAYREKDVSSEAFKLENQYLLEVRLNGLVRTPLKVMEMTLDPAVFARTHRSTIVNLARVADAQSLSDGSWRLTMVSGAELVVSRSFRDEILERQGMPAVRPISNVS